MDRHEPQIQMNSFKADSEVSALDRILGKTKEVLKSSKNRLSKVAAGATIAIALTGCGTNANAEPTAPPTPTTTSIEETPVATETPIESETPAVNEELAQFDRINDPAITPENQAQRLSELQFSSEMTPEEMGEHYSEVISSWAMAGATPELRHSWIEQMVAEVDVAAPVAENNRETYAIALFGENYANNDDVRIQNFINNSTVINQSNIIRYFLTHSDDRYPNSNTENIQAWNAHIINTVVTDVEQTDTSLSMTVTQETNSNAQFNIVNGTEGDDDGHIAETRLEFDTSTGTPFITSISITDIN